MAARGADFGPVQQIALADDTNKAAARVDHRGAADAAFRKQRCQGPDRRVRIDRDHISRHHVYRAHYAPPSVQRLTAAPRFVRVAAQVWRLFSPRGKKARPVPAWVILGHGGIQSEWPPS